MAKPVLYNTITTIFPLVNNRLYRILNEHKIFINGHWYISRTGIRRLIKLVNKSLNSHNIDTINLPAIEQISRKIYETQL